MFQAHRLVVGQQHLLLALRVVDGDTDQFEVDRVVVVHDQEAVVAALHGMFHVVLDAVLPRPDHGELAGRVCGFEQPGLGGHARTGLDQQEPAAAGEADAHPEPLVRLVEDRHVCRGRGADLVAPHGVGSPGVVHGRIEHVTAARVEQGTLAGVRDLVRKVLPGRDGAHAQGVPLVALGVDGVEQPALVEAHIGAAERVELVAGGFGVVVEHDLLARQSRGDPGVLPGGRLRQHGRVPVVGSGNRCPAVDAVLLSLDRAGVVPPVALSHRHAEVGLLGAASDLLEDLLLQQGEVCGAGIRECVLGFEMRDHLRTVLVPQPFVVVGEHVVVETALLWLLHRAGRSGHGFQRSSAGAQT